MADGILSKETSDILNALYKKFGSKYNYAEFWDYVRQNIGKNPPLGDPAYQETYIWELFRDWATKVNAGQLPQPKTITPTVATQVTPETTTPTTEPSWGGYTASEWGLGIPQFEWQKKQDTEQALRQQSQFATQQAANQTEINARNWQAEQMAKAKGLELSNTRMQALISPTLGNTQETQRQANELQWENMRNQILGSIENTPRNWIKTSPEVIQSISNPYAAPNRGNPQDITNEITNTQNQIKQLESAKKNLESRVGDNNDPLLQKELYDSNTPEGRMYNLINMGIQGAKDSLTQLQTTQITPAIQALSNKYGMSPESARATALRWGANLPGGEFANISGEENAALTRAATEAMGAPTPPGSYERVTTPAIPTWLQQTSGINKAFVPTTRTNVLTPSGQSWGNLSDTQRQMYAGLIDFSGNRSFADVMNIDVSEILKKKIEENKKKSFKAIDESDFLLSGHPAHKVNYSSPTERIMTVAAIKNERVYSVYYSAGDELLFNNNLEIVENMFSSFKFVN